MVIDTSAVIAILEREPEAEDFISKITSDTVRLISAPNAFEASMVIGSRKGEEGLEYLDSFFNTANISIIPFNSKHYEGARQAWWKYGKGRHRASLNFGDCFAYALAKHLNYPLLYKGNDFSETDIVPVLDVDE